ncbi:tetratricopeptide repeat protein [Spirillospora sp. CA-294931]|uniref:tetratricopeptide repeat protein n=1 Tax=Spirillospora sp. CA-294931 TaxID=3240042 RepID=UPI003D8AFF16
MALRIAGQRGAARPHLPLAEILAELGDQDERLDVLSASDDETTSVRAVFAWSYRGLSPERQLLFRRLGLHPGTDITGYAAAALTDTTPSWARRALEALADIHLVEAFGPDLYRVHDLLRAYALERAETDDTREDRHAALRRLHAFYLHTSDAADRRLVIRNRHSPDAAPVPPHVPAFTTDEQARDWLRVEYSNLLAVVGHAADMGMHDLAWQISATMFATLDRLGHRNDWLITIQTGLASTRKLSDRVGEFTMLRAMVAPLTSLRRFDEAIDCGQQALNIARDAGEPADEASALDNLGGAYFEAGQRSAAADCYQASLDIQEEVGNDWAAAISQNRLGEVHRDRRRFDNGIDCHRRALKTFRAHQDLTREGWTLRLLGDAHLALGQFDQAIDYQTQAVAVLQGPRSLDEMARALCTLGDALEATGERRQAREHWSEPLTIFESCRLDRK